MSIIKSKSRITHLYKVIFLHFLLVKTRKIHFLIMWVQIIHLSQTTKPPGYVHPDKIQWESVAFRDRLTGIESEFYSLVAE